MTGFLKLADIRARDECLVAGADQDHDAHLGIIAQFDQGMTEPLPHVERHGVAFFRVIESDDADAISDALLDFAIGVGFLGALGDVQHRSGFRY